MDHVDSLHSSLSPGVVVDASEFAGFSIKHHRCTVTSCESAENAKENSVSPLRQNN
jgi:hypothetical protein